MTNYEKECKEHKKEVIKALSKYYGEYQECETCRIKSYCREIKHSDFEYLLCEGVWYGYLVSEAEDD